MQGKVFLTSTGYDPALGREVRDPTLEGAMSGDAADVVAELDAELALIEELPYRVPIHLLAKRARDEIVALRKLTDGDWVWKQITDTRDEALEEAARVTLRWQDTACGEFDKALAIAKAIRALKDKPKCP